MKPPGCHVFVRGKPGAATRRGTSRSVCSSGQYGTFKGRVFALSPDPTAVNPKLVHFLVGTRLLPEPRAGTPALQVEWDKGCALAHLLGALGLDTATDVLPIYIGDDRTDEDAFRLLAQRPCGFGILVSTRVRSREDITIR